MPIFITLHYDPDHPILINLDHVLRCAAINPIDRPHYKGRAQSAVWIQNHGVLYVAESIADITKLMGLPQAS